MRALEYQDNPAFSSTKVQVSQRTRAPMALVLLLLALTASSLLPQAASAVIQLIAIVAALLSTILIPRYQRRAPSTTTWVWLIVAYWFILIFLPNIPSLEVGVLGFRKTVFCLLGLVLASSVSHLKVKAVELATILILLASLLASLLLFLLFPSIEAALVDRGDADIYTGLFAGAPRLQGIFAGPFHAAIGSLILLVWGLTRFSSYKLVATFSIVVGAACLNLTNVRTAYVALLLSLLFVAVLSPSISRAVKRLVMLVAFAVLVFYLVLQFFPDRMQFFTQIINFDEDTRFTGRIAGYSEGLSLISRSPLWGWGAGSAGDTLEPFFISREHITSHNLFLKIAVEGGAIGLFLWSGLVTSILRHLPRSINTSATAIGLIFALLGMGLTGSAVEGLPLTFILFFLVGLYLHSRQEQAKPGRLISPAPKRPTAQFDPKID